MIVSLYAADGWPHPTAVHAIKIVLMTHVCHNQTTQNISIVKGNEYRLNQLKKVLDADQVWTEV